MVKPVCVCVCTAHAHPCGHLSSGPGSIGAQIGVPTCTPPPVPMATPGAEQVSGRPESVLTGGAHVTGSPEAAEPIRAPGLRLQEEVKGLPDSQPGALLAVLSRFGERETEASFGGEDLAGPGSRGPRPLPLWRERDRPHPPPAPTLGTPSS